MRAALWLLLLTGCPVITDSDDATLDSDWSFASHRCRTDEPLAPKAFSAVALHATEVEIDGRPIGPLVDLFDAAACDDDVVPKEVYETFISDPIQVGAINELSTLCYFEGNGRFVVANDVATIDIPALDVFCVENLGCPNHVDAMRPIYQFGLELLSNSNGLCGSTSLIEVVQLLLSNNQFTSPPSGDHVEGQLGIATRHTLAPTLLGSRVLTNPQPLPFLLGLYKSDSFIGGTVGLSIFQRTAPGASSLLPIVDPPPGDYFMFAQVLKGNVPERDPVNYYQYAFVFDSDGNTTNNYTPLPQYPADFFKDTDRWYELLYTPTAGWTAKASTANGSQIRPAQSAAQIYAVGSVIFLLVPASEFAVPNPSYRFTAFRHKGDYGLNPPHDFSGYVDPPVAEGLHAFTP